ncbi:MAG: ROK family protein [Saprospiraceae bacterium]|nr:ROK family protein [Saprospiraceae bacterium]MBK8450773.1 ROK family protein [Saprospiraceae bacterium]MBK9223055.1 ROK family protein [Saprospiraceae bacterium]MBK9720585.1 ROK family protein [Saprospiraceae bacterium]
MSNLLWGIDLGGTKIEGVAINTFPSLQIIQRMRVPTEADQGYDHILSQIKLLIDQIREKTGSNPTHLGIGTPGIVDKETHLIKNSNTLGLIGRPMKEDLESLLGIEVRMANDANCFAIAEANLGAVPDIVKNPEVVFGVIMGTGVGGGIVVNGKVIHGKHGIGGEWGHNILDDSGDACYCGKKGCVETFISGPACERYYSKISGVKLPMAEIYKLYLIDDPKAKETMDRLVHYFGKALAIIINIIDPEVIVFGGGLGNLDVLYKEGKEEVRKYIFNYELKTHFIKPKLGDSAGVIGAALL